MSWCFLGDFKPFPRHDAVHAVVNVKTVSEPLNSSKVSPLQKAFFFLHLVSVKRSQHKRPVEAYPLRGSCVQISFHFFSPSTSEGRPVSEGQNMKTCYGAVLFHRFSHALRKNFKISPRSLLSGDDGGRLKVWVSQGLSCHCDRGRVKVRDRVEMWCEELCWLKAATWDPLSDACVRSSHIFN